ncbi:hypothetical protein GCM10011490_15260 [Pseudoclavibacter endophyticus]|uniref:AcrB/AcrD/AcrF family protein n=1 Tax=Pseudoclavibacter endophyticus TaxID=1778590 RepID=A0A6H9WM38_9MICO|nr:efflux RND transporter permease subunit [Pseudoclavibacter endophyticus]KAB1649088.1 AcrB/AcrD/AcrF family protein [Pseudoclavibacter endophyticus]GGA65552.1 hypothetical protein GCM10011490_15260 [Pseudoclavibacter endophyticus]
MHRLASLSLANRALIALVTAAIAFFGVISMTSLKQELVPSVTLPIVSVVTSLPGASPEVIDEDVSRPIEASLQGLEGLENTTTTSSTNVSSVMVEFQYGTDLVYAQQRIQVALNRVQETLPEGATTNVVAGSIDDFPVLQLAVVGDDTDEVANLLRIEALGDLLEIDGVRDATLSGAPSPRIAITPDQAQLAASGASTQTITDTLDASGSLIPIGQLTEGDETLTVQAGALLSSAEDIAALPLEGATGAGGQPVTIGDVATVEQDTEPVASISRVNGQDALTISVTKRPDANTVTVSQAVRDLIPELESKLGAGIAFTIAFDQAPFIEQSIETLVIEGLLGLAFAVIVIFVFLLSARATIVTAISIPTSLLVTFIGLQAADYSLNILTLGALTISIGRVVDDSIVVIENINRHMAMHPAASRRGSERAAVITGAVREVAGAIAASTIATVAVFLPIAFVSDISGELFRPFALTSVIALLASLVVALTIVPVLAYWMLGGASTKRRRAKTAAPAVGGGPLLDSVRAGTPAPATAGADAQPRGGQHEVTGARTGADARGAQTSADDDRRRPRASEQRAAADRERFSPLALRDETADDPRSRPGTSVPDPAADEAGAPPRGSTEHPHLSADDLPRDASTGEITLSRRALRELRERYGSDEVDAALGEARHGDPTYRPQPEQQQQSRDDDHVAASSSTPGDAPDAPTAGRQPAVPAGDDGVLDDEPRTWLQRGFEPVLTWTLRRPAITLVAAVLVLVLTGLLVPLMKTNFLGDMAGNTFSVTQTLPPNASLEARDEAARQVEDVLMATEGIETVQLTISGGGGGFFGGAGGSGGGSTASFSVIASDDADLQELQSQVRGELSGNADLGEISVSEAGGAGLSSDLTVEVTAPTNEALGQTAQQVTEALAAEPGIVEVSSSLDSTSPFVQLEVDPAAAAQYGLSELMIGGMVAQQMQPRPVGDLVIDGESVSVYLLGGDPPQSLDELRSLQLVTALGPVPLSTVASIEVVDGPVAITAERGTPTATVTIVPESDDLSTMNPLVEGVLDGLELPAGASVSVGGVSADQAEAFEQLGLALLAAILIVYIIMVATFKSLLQPFLLLVSIPFAATGAVLLQLVADIPLGVSSIIGVLMLIGIVVTNAIVLIDLVNQFRNRGHDVREAIVHGGSRRVRPIVMTALATIFALLPMALGITGHSGFISQPLAVTVIGGLLSSTVLTLLVLPALYLVVEGPRERRRKQREARAEAELAAAGLD